MSFALHVTFKAFCCWLQRISERVPVIINIHGLRLVHKLNSFEFCRRDHRYCEI